MDKILVEGGRRLAGEVRVGGAKNAALPILVSSLLADGPCIYHNVPNLKDIESILLLLKDLGARVEREGSRVEIDPRTVDKCEAPYDLVRKMRASILVLGPLVARLKQARVSLPGGCAIGARPINYHLRGLRRLGAEVDLSHGYVEARAAQLTGAEIYFDFPTVTGTENVMMAAALASGTTVLRNVAMEPEIVALADVLNRMGADIRGAGTSKIIIQGVDALHSVTETIIPDRIEAGTFMVAAALTGGDIHIPNACPDHLEAVIHKLRLTGAQVETDAGIRVIGADAIMSTDIKTDPYPGFPTDMQAQFMVLMTVAGGLSQITETVFENRFIHVSELNRMGADIKVPGGNVALVTGVPSLSGAPVMASDLRASASLVLAGLVASGTTEVNRVYHLDRGYEALEVKLEQLGAAIRRVS